MIYQLKDWKENKDILQRLKIINLFFDDEGKILVDDNEKIGGFILKRLREIARKMDAQEIKELVNEIQIWLGLYEVKKTYEDRPDYFKKYYWNKRRELGKPIRKKRDIQAKDRKEYMKLYRKLYYKENKEKFKEQWKKYYKQNKQKRKEYMEKYYKENKEKIKQKHKKWYAKNREKILQKLKEWYLKNRERKLKYLQEYREKKNKED